MDGDRTPAAKMNGSVVLLVCLGGLTLGVVREGIARADPGPPGDRLFLTFGSSEFRALESGDGWPDLPHAEKDARDIAAYLTELGFEGWREQPVVGRTYTSTTVHAQLEGLLRVLERDHDRSRTVVIYFSSHGFLTRRDESGRLMIATHASPRSISNQDASPEAIDLDQLVVRYGPRFHAANARVAIVVDACSLPGGKTVGTRWKGELDPSGRAELEDAARRQATVTHYGPTLMILMATSRGRPALDRPSDDNSLYTRFLLEALRDQDPRGVSLTEAHRRASDATARASDGMQKPTITIPLETDGREIDFLLLGREPPPRGPLVVITDLIEGLWVRAEQVGVMGKGEGGIAPGLPIRQNLSHLPSGGEWRFSVMDDANRSLGDLQTQVDGGAVHISLREVIGAPATRLGVSAAWRTPVVRLGDTELYLVPGPTVDLGVTHELAALPMLRLGAQTSLFVTPEGWFGDERGRRELLGVRAGPLAEFAMRLNRTAELIGGVALDVGGLSRTLRLGEPSADTQAWMIVGVRVRATLGIRLSPSIDLLASIRASPTLVVPGGVGFVDVDGGIGVGLHRDFHPLRD